MELFKKYEARLIEEIQKNAELEVRLDEMQASIEDLQRRACEEQAAAINNAIEEAQARVRVPKV